MSTFEELKQRLFGRADPDDIESLREATREQIEGIVHWLKHPITQEFFDKLEVEGAKHEGPVDMQFAPYAVGFRDALSAVRRIRRDYERYVTYERD